MSAFLEKSIHFDLLDIHTHQKRGAGGSGGGEGGRGD